LAWVFPLVIPTYYNTNSIEDTRFRSVSTTKIVQRFGILDETVTFDRNRNSEISQKILALDEETGEVLLSKVNNEYSDEYYSVNYPAHWVYNQMGQAYKNTGLVSHVTVNSDQTITCSDPEILIPGNELGFISSWGNITYAWVGLNTEDQYYVEPRSSGLNFSPGEWTVKVIRSGRRNQSSLPVANIVCNEFSYPYNFSYLNEINKIQSAGATEYYDKWDNNCECSLPPNTNTNNPFLLGKEGSWRPQKSLTYVTDREYLTSEVSLREGGNYDTFIPYWNYNNSEWEKSSDPNWKWVQEVTMYNPYGEVIEEVNALEIPSSAIYRNYLPITVNQNARHKEVAYDGFEDYPDPYILCNEGHFDFLQFITVPMDYISNEQAHSGKRSIKVGQNQSLSTTKPVSGCN